MHKDEMQLIFQADMPLGVNSDDPDQTGVHRLLFGLHSLEALSKVKLLCSNFTLI